MEAPFFQLGGVYCGNEFFKMEGPPSEVVTLNPDSKRLGNLRWVWGRLAGASIPFNKEAKQEVDYWGIPPRRLLLPSDTLEDANALISDTDDGDEFIGGTRGPLWKIKVPDLILEMVASKNLALCGGAASAAVLGTAGDGPSDFDIFPIGPAGWASAEREIKKLLRNNALLIVSGFAVTVRFGETSVQFIRRSFDSVQDVLDGFDLDICCVGICCGVVSMAPRAKTAFLNRTNVVRPGTWSRASPHRARKYAERGFGLSVPGLPWARVSKWGFMAAASPADQLLFPRTESGEDSGGLPLDVPMTTTAMNVLYGAHLFNSGSTQKWVWSSGTPGSLEIMLAEVPQETPMCFPVEHFWTHRSSEDPPEPAPTRGGYLFVHQRFIDMLGPCHMNHDRLLWLVPDSDEWLPLMLGMEGASVMSTVQEWDLEDFEPIPVHPARLLRHDAMWRVIQLIEQNLPRERWTRSDEWVGDGVWMLPRGDGTFSGRVTLRVVERERPLWREWRVV